MLQPSNYVPAPVFKVNVESHKYFSRDEDNLGLANDANGNGPSVPSLWGVPLKYISLITLAIQNSLLTIVMHQSRVSTPPEHAYSAATAVLMNEILKGSISFIIAFSRMDASIVDATQSSRPSLYTSRLRRLSRDILSADCWKLSIPAILYVVQNNLQFVAASNLEAATFQVTYQMKILTTAAFSVLLLRKKLSPVQWLSLLFLAIGVGIVQIQGITKTSALGLRHMDAMKGFLAVVAACFTSGLAGVYFEMVLKNSQGDLWVRNVQLSMFSLLPAVIPVFFGRDHSHDDTKSLISSIFHNFGFWAWATVSIQVFGGLITAMVIKYSDNILKGFATSLSIVISFLASVALFDFHMTFPFVLGSAIVLNATWLYNQQPKRLGLVTAKEASALTRSWNEKWKVMRSPAVVDQASKSTLSVALSSVSRSSSVNSLSSHFSTGNSPPLSADVDGKFFVP